MAKRKLEPGERLDGVGGYTCYGKIENVINSTANPGLPICLADNVILNRSIAKDQKIMMTDVNYEPNRPDYELYSEALMQIDTRHEVDQ